MARDLRVRIVGDASSYERALNRTSKATSSVSGVFKKLALAAAGAFAVKEVVQFGETVVKAAMAAQEANDKLTQSFKNEHIAMTAMSPAVLSLEAAGRRLGFSNEETRASLTKLINAGKSYKDSVAEIAVAQNLARVSGQSLSDSVTGLIRLQGGALRAAKQYGIVLPDLTSKQWKAKAAVDGITVAQEKGQYAYDALTKKVEGQGEAFSKTAAGGISVFKAQLSDLEEHIGAKILPILSKLLNELNDHWPQIKAAILNFWNGVKPVLASLVDALQAAWPIAQKAIEIFLPVLRDVGRVVKGVVDLVSALLRGDWSAAWTAAKTIVMGVLNGIVDYMRAWSSLLWGAFGGTFKAVFVTPFQNAWAVVSNWLRDNWIKLVAALFAGLPGIIWLALQGPIQDKFVTPLKTTFTGIGTWIKDEVGRWAGYVAALPGRIADFGKGLLATISGFVNAAGIAKFLQDKITAFANFFESLPGKIGDALSRGVKGAVGRIKGWFSDLFSWLPGWAKDILGIHSPSKVFEDIGEHIVGGLIKGLGNMAGKLKDKAAAVVGVPIDWAKKAVGAVGAVAGAIGGALGGGHGAGSPQANRLLGMALAQTNFGWGANQFASLDALWRQESGWNQFAKNPTSGAYGIPQALPPTKMPFAAQEVGGSNPFAQIMWGLNYIKSRYGDPISAWGGYWARGGWYAKGGIFSRPTIIGVGEAGREAVVPLDRGLGLGLTINVTVQGALLGSSVPEVADTIYRELVRKSGRNSGRLGLA